MKLYKSLISIIITIFFILITDVSFGKEVKNDNLSYSIVTPNNQKNKNVNYFDLKMKPEQEQTIYIEMSNSSDFDRIIFIEINNAKTNSNGVIEYGPSLLKNDSSLKHNFDDFIEYEKSIIIPANKTIQYPIKVKMPNELFDGVIAGGIFIKEKVDENKRKDDLVQNDYAYILSIILSETSTKVTPILEFRDISFFTENPDNKLVISYANVSPVYIDNMSIDIKVNDKETDMNIYNEKKNNMRMAPNSKISLPIFLDKSNLRDGNYVVNVTVVTNKEKKWSFEKRLNLSSTNEEIQENKTDSKFEINWILIFSVLIFCSFLLICTLIIKQALK